MLNNAKKGSTNLAVLAFGLLYPERYLGFLGYSPDPRK